MECGKGTNTIMLISVFLKLNKMAEANTNSQISVCNRTIYSLIKSFKHKTALKIRP